MGKNVGSTLGGIAGGVVGFVGSGFNPYGAVAGYTAGSALGAAIDPVTGKKVAAPNLGGVIKQGDTYAGLSEQQRKLLESQQSSLQSAEISKALSERALGRGPSLAEAQLRSATNRNLSQQLAAAASMRGRNVGATQRQLLQQQGEAGRNLAQDSAVARMQEQQAAQSQALNQGNILASSLNQNLQSGYGFKTGARIQQAQMQQQTDALNSQIAAANQQSQNQMTGALLEMGGKLGAAYYGAGGAGTMKPTVSSSSPSLVKSISIPASVQMPASNREFDPTRLNAYEGGVVPGIPEVDGNHIVNDKVKAMLSPGEIVIPRSHATSPEKAKKFVQQLLENMPKDIKPKKDIRDAIHAKYMKKKV